MALQQSTKALNQNIGWGYEKPIFLKEGLIIDPLEGSYPKLSAFGEIYELDDNTATYVINSFYKRGNTNCVIIIENGEEVVAKRVESSSKNWTHNLLGTGLTSRIEPIVINVGNYNSSVINYDFLELADALSSILQVNISCKNDGKRPIRISIPAGSHTFLKPIDIRGANLSHVQIWCDPTATIRCGLNEKNVWFTLMGCTFGDIYGFKKLLPLEDVNISDDPAEVCIEGITTPIMRWFSFNGCIIMRFQDIGFDGDTSGVRSAIGVESQSTLFLYSDGLSFKNIRTCGSYYIGTTVYGGEGLGYNAQDTYIGFVVHDATMYIRKINISGYLNAGSPYIGSIGLDAVRANISTHSGSVIGFESKYIISDSDIGDRLISSNITTAFKILTDGSEISTVEKSLPSQLLLSSNTINTITSTNGVGIISSDQIEYTGNGLASQIVTPPATAPNIRKVTIRRKSSLGEISCLRGKIAYLGNDPAIFVSEFNTVTVYAPSGTNTNGVVYSLIYE